jgi:hypothetical protein
LARSSVSRDIFLKSSLIAVSPAEVSPTKGGALGGVFPGDRKPIGGSALKPPNSPRRTLYVATGVPVRCVEKMTVRMRSESTLFPATKKDWRKTHGLVCRMLDTECGRKASQNADCHRRVGKFQRLGLGCCSAPDEWNCRTASPLWPAVSSRTADAR